MREAFEQHIRDEVATGHHRINAWALFERSGDSYLDLYLALRWRSWQACWSRTGGP